jgi:hypothetical protein
MQMKFISIILFYFFLIHGVVKSEELPVNWYQKTIGPTQITGSGSFSNNVFTVSGSGSDIWENSEEYHYVYTNVADSIEIIAKIDKIENTNNWAKAGIMIKQNPFSLSALAVLSYSPNKSLVFAIRKKEGETITGEQGDQSDQQWMKLVYKRNVIAAYSSVDGLNWNLVGTPTGFKFSGPFCVGLVSCSHVKGVFCKAEFSNVTIKKPEISLEAYERGKYFSKKVYIPKELPVFSTSKSSLPEPILDNNPEWIKLYWATWDFAFNHLRKPLPGSTFVSNWLDEAFNEVVTAQWDLIFCSVYGRYAYTVFPAINSLDNFYINQHPNGMICRILTEATGDDHFWGLGIENCRAVNPPLYAWAEINNYKITSDKKRLVNALPAIEKNFEWVEKNRKGIDTPHKLYWSNGQASGMDNTPRDNGRPEPGDGWDSHSAKDHMGWVDLSSQLVIEAKNISSICNILGNTSKAHFYSNKAEEIGALINKWMWNEHDGLYYDVNVLGKQTNWKTIACFWPMMAGITDSHKEAKLIANLKDTTSFCRAISIPALAADQKFYDPSGHYWEGGVWAPTNYAVVKGLEQTGHHKIAQSIAEKYLTGMSEVYRQTNTVWELYSPDKINGKYKQGTYSNGLDCGKEYVGWSGLGPIAMLIEDIIGLDTDAPNNTVTWQLTRMDHHGIKNLHFGSVTTSILAESRTDKDRVKITVESNNDFHLKVNFQGKDFLFNVKSGSNSFSCNTTLFTKKLIAD